MTDPIAEPPRRRIRSIEAAAIAGLAFAVLYAIVEIIFLSVPRLGDATEEVLAWHGDGGNRAVLFMAFNLAVFASIAFLWFVAVLRRRIGDREDQFFATVFLGSALLFVGLYLVGLGVRVSIVLGFIAGERVPDAGDLALVDGAANAIVVVAMPRMQALFVVATSTIGRRTGALAGWLSLAGYIFALFLIVIPLFTAIPGLGFGLWVALVSGSLLIRSRQAE